MTTPRADIVDPESPGFYHCVSRCVRRAFLCGTDSDTGRSFEHRKAWVEGRLLELAEVFAVGVCVIRPEDRDIHQLVVFESRRVVFLGMRGQVDFPSRELAFRVISLAG